MGLQFAERFWRRLGGCCLLPEMEPRQGLVNPSCCGRSVAGKSSCPGRFGDVREHKGDFMNPGREICKHCGKMVRSTWWRKDFGAAVPH